MDNSSMFADCLDPTVRFFESISPKRPSISDPPPYDDSFACLDHHGAIFDMYAYAYPVDNPGHTYDFDATVQDDSGGLTVSPPQLVYNDSDYSPTSTIIDDLAGSPFQHEFPLSQSSLGLENITLYPQSAPTSPLVGISELSNLPNTSPTISQASIQERIQEDSIIVTPQSDARDAYAESEGEALSEESEPSEYGGSDSSDDDDEYVPVLFTKAKRGMRAKPPAKAPRSGPPSSTTRPRPSRSSRSSRSPRYSPYASPSPTPSTSSLSSSSEAGSPGGRSAQLRHTSSRKKQVSRADAVSQSRNGTSRLGCPHCKYVQQNRRMPDLRRHIAGHCKTEDYVCCGVPLDRAEEYCIPADDLGEAQEWKGEFRVGGCWQVCSRRDALIRHLKNKKRTCVCDVLSIEALKTSRKPR